jgi:LPS export ABC transporter protein LptC
MDPDRQHWLFLFLLFCLYTASCGPRADDRPQVFTRDDAAVELVKTVEILYSDSARVRVRILAPELLNIAERENPRQEFPQGVTLEFLDAQGAVSSTLTAKTAFRYPELGQVIARDSVVVHTRKNENLETEELIWDEKTQKIRTEKFVKVGKPGEVLYGFGLEAEQDFSYWRILTPKGNIKSGQLDQALE